MTELFESAGEAACINQVSKELKRHSGLYYLAGPNSRFIDSLFASEHDYKVFVHMSLSSCGL